MSIFTDIIGTLGGDLVKSLDGLFTSDEDRLKLQTIMQKAVLDAQSKAKEQELNMEKELTKRLESDMKSDSWLAKNVRPGSLVFLLIVVTVLALTDGNLSWGEWSFDIGASYVSLYENLLLTAFAFYYGGRSLEKATKIKQEKKDD